MCGIVGIWQDTGGDTETVNRMLQMMRHRGPDGSGVDVEGRYVTGAVRLAVTGGAGGAQPVYSGCGRFSLVFNGEIYNYHSLCGDTGGSIYCDNTDGDSVALLNYLQKHGEAGLNDLAGPFALAFKNHQTGEILLARDRMGQKPLYVLRRQEGAGDIEAFASETRPLLFMSGIREIDSQSLCQYLARKYVPGISTMHSSIKRFPRRSWLITGKNTDKSGEIKPLLRSRYYPDERRNIEIFRDNLKASVQCRVLAEKKVALMLSGGIDSSAIAASLPVGHKPPALIMVPEGMEDYGDLENAREVATTLGLQTTEVLIGPEVYQEWLDNGPVDEPVGDPGMVSLWYLARRAAEMGFGVLLNGAGADELMGGYDFCYRAAIFYELQRYPDSSEYLCHSPLSAQAAMTGSDALSRFTSIFSSTEIKELTGLDVGDFDDFDCLSGDDCIMRNDGPVFADYLRKILNFTTGSWLTNYQLALCDYMSMSASVELRAPFMDERVIGFLLGVPPEQFHNGVIEKHLLRAAFSDLLPQKVVWSRKRPYMVPVNQWLRGPLKNSASDRLEHLGEWGLLDPAIIRRLWTDHLDGRDYGGKIWNLLVLQKYLASLECISG